MIFETRNSGVELDTLSLEIRKRYEEIIDKIIITNLQSVLDNPKSSFLEIPQVKLSELTTEQELQARILGLI